MKKIIAFLAMISLSGLHAATFTVTNTAAAGAGSMNQAVTDANNLPDTDVIEFNIPGAAPFIISGGFALTQPVVINGASQPGYNGVPLIEFSGAAGAGFLIAGSANNCEIIGLSIVSSTGQGILIASSNNKVSGCYVGIRADGVTAAGNAGHGIEVGSGCNGNIIGGVNRNILSSNAFNGIIFTNSDNNFVFNTIIGLASNGITVRANSQSGINFNNGCDNNRIGGTTSDSMNVVGGNLQQGILLSNNCRFNVILGNYVGCALDGITDVGNGIHGISIGSSTDNIIGGVGAICRNVVSGNAVQGIDLSFSPRTIIKSNYIGVSASGLLAMPNDIICVNVEASRQCIIGGDRNTEGNVISNSKFVHGLELKEFGGTKSNKCIVQGNFIGTDKDGLQNFGNFVIGFSLKSDSCLIGGDLPSLGNVICNTKLLCGLSIANANANIVKNNLIGITVDSTSLPNVQDGITIAVENSGNTAQFNRIEYNVIAFNGRHGVNVGEDLGTFTSNQEASNKIRFNKIFCNTEKGIHLKRTLATDRGNNGKRSPNINTALSNDFTIVGLLPSGLIAGDTIDLYRMTDCASCDTALVQGPQGKYHLGFTVVQPNGSWSYTSATSITDRIVATATDAGGNTSEFSMCYRPCKATAEIEQTSMSVYLKDNSSQTLDLSGIATFSSQNPTPGKVFWMINSADTTNAVNTTNSITVTLAGNGSGDLGAGTNTVYFVSNQEGCMDTARVQITILYIPNLITPNGDGKNDSWFISSTGGLYEVSIYNRWGDRVFKADDYTDNWTAESLSDGAYFYEIVDKSEKKERYKGWVQVVR